MKIWHTKVKQPLNSSFIEQLNKQGYTSDLYTKL